MDLTNDTPEELFGPSLPAHLYVHVPFCTSKCGYCDFASVSDAAPNVVFAVFTGIRTQVTRWSLAALDGVLETIYIGGGTPTCHPDEVVRLLDHIRDHLSLQSDAEITVEGNPDSLTPKVIRQLARAGVTRISVGVQSFDDAVLRILGRRHDAARAWDACLAVRDERLDLSLDLICGVPGQSITSWSETLAKAAATGAHHVSVYPLSIEDDTPMQVAISAGLLDHPDPDVAAEMMILAENTLGYHGLGRYEVANYAEDRAHESRHNSAYWLGRQYIGVGPGAHGMLDSETARTAGLVEFDDGTTARVRYANAADIEQWLVGSGDTSEVLTAEEAAREDVMLGMRLVRGIPAAQVESAGLTSVLESLAEDGLVERASDAISRPGPNWRTTRRGWLLGNQVFSRIWAGE